jgi:prepilin-type N-terminal cleavage/methylation domain-containing protein
MAARAFPTRSQTGFSLIELMVALLLGLLLMSGIIAVYLESKRGFVQDEAIARVQENGRYALRLLSREIAMAGFLGGVTELDKITSPAVSDCQTWLLDPDEVIEVYDDADGNETAAFNDCFGAAIDGADTDILAVRRASDIPLIDDGEWETGFTGLTATRHYLNTFGDGLKTAAIELGSDLDTGELTSPGSTADVWAYYGRIYYIGTENGVPSLCVRSVENPAQTCLVNGVESLQLELGVDTDGDAIPDEFVSDRVADEPGAVDADTVLSMRVHLLVRSLAPVRTSAAESRTWNLGNQTLTTNDQFYRRVFTATVPRNNQVFTTYQ